jgi:hypothetical protein
MIYVEGMNRTHHKVEDHVPDLLPDLGRDVQAEFDQSGEELLDFVDDPLVAYQLATTWRAPRLCTARGQAY